MGNNKSPGSDGIIVDFYKLFVNHYLIDLIHFSFEHGYLKDLQKQGVISLIPKSGKDLEFLQNWGPVSLFNIDYKIATKAISLKKSYQS